MNQTLTGIREGWLRTEELITHRFPDEKAADAWHTILENKAKMSGCAFGLMKLNTEMNSFISDYKLSMIENNSFKFLISKSGIIPSEVIKSLRLIQTAFIFTLNAPLISVLSLSPTMMPSSA